MPLPLLAALAVAVTTLLLLSLRAMAVTGVPVYAAGRDAVATALDLLDPKDGERFCELGCGFGAVVRAARRRADVHVRAFELNPAVAAVAALRSLSDSKVRIRVADVRRADLGRPHAVYLYLMPHLLPAVRDVLEAQLAPGGRVASVDFEIPGWTAAETRHCRGGQTIFFYIPGAPSDEALDPPPPAAQEEGPEEEGREREGHGEPPP